MTRLTRKNIKVFAGESSDNGIFGSLQENNPVLTNDVEQIQSLRAWSEGWNSATYTSEELPPLEEFQGVQYVVTYQQAYLMQEGLPEWARTVTYYKGSLVKEVTANGFRIYSSLTDDNTNNHLSDAASWKLVMDSDDLYALKSDLDTKADTVDVVTLATNQTITGTKTFQGPNKLVVQNPNIRAGTAPSQNIDTPIAFRDSEYVRAGEVYHSYDTNKNSSMTIQSVNMNNATGGDDNLAQIRVTNPATGLPYTYAPTTTSNTGNQIVTSGWFAKSLLKNSSSTIDYTSSIASGVVVPSNGVLVLTSNYGEFTLYFGSEYSMTVGGRGGNYSAKGTVVVPVALGTRLTFSSTPVSAIFYY